MRRGVGIVYLLHFDSRYKHAGHYLGFVECDLEQRILEHERGLGANLVRVARDAGIDFSLARTWNGDRYRERRLKRWGGASRICPLCAGRGARIEHRDVEIDR